MNLSLGIYDSNQPGQLLGSTVINSYSAFAIPAYWRAINFLGGNLASFPRSVRLRGQQIDRPHPLDRLLERKPNPYQTATVFWRHVFAQMIQEGNGYAKILRASKTSNQIVGLENVSPYDVTPFRLDGVQYYYVQCDYDLAKQRGLTDDEAARASIYNGADILHFPGLGYDGMIGYPPVILLRETFQRARNVDRFLTRFLEKGTVIRGVIEIPGDTPDDKLESIVKMLRTYFVGADAERDIPLLTGGAKFNNATLSPQDSQLDKQLTYTTKQIAQITGVHPHFLFDDSEGKYNATVTQAGEDVVRYTFRPLLDVIEDELTVKLLTEQEQATGYTIHCDPNALLRGDIQTRAAVAVSLKAAGIINANEVRQDLGYRKSDDPEADKLKTSGDTSKTLPTPTSTPQASDEPVKSATPEHPERASFADALKPLLADACERVDAKTAKAFEKKTDKITPVWVNVFAGEQERYAHEALRPVAVALEKLGGEGIDVDRVAQRYAASIRKRASDGTVISLATIVTEVTGGKDERPADE